MENLPQSTGPKKSQSSKIKNGLNAALAAGMLTGLTACQQEGKLQTQKIEIQNPKGGLSFQPADKNLLIGGTFGTEKLSKNQEIMIYTLYGEDKKEYDFYSKQVKDSKGKVLYRNDFMIIKGDGILNPVQWQKSLKDMLKKGIINQNDIEAYSEYKPDDELKLANKKSEFKNAVIINYINLVGEKFQSEFKKYGKGLGKDSLTWLALSYIKAGENPKDFEKILNIYKNSNPKNFEDMIEILPQNLKQSANFVGKNLKTTK